jgi:hypothetical protein
MARSTLRYAFPLAGLLFLATPAAAADRRYFVTEDGQQAWHPIVENPIARFYIAVRAWDEAPKTTKEWIKLVLKPESSFYKKGIRTVIEYAEYDCAARTSRHLQETQYYADGHHTSFGATGTVKFIIPGSTGETILEFLCD